MVVEFDQGPGRNIDFCLITTGLNIDPDQGGWARELYQHLKTVIQERAEIHFENRKIREIFDVDVSSILPAYTPNPRTVYQFLFGLVEHSNSWTGELLTEELNESLLSQKLKPQNGEFSIDFVQSQTDGFKLFENVFVAGTGDVWVEKQQFYYSTKEPETLDGDIGDIWFVSDINGNVELWYKPMFQWVKLFDYVTTTSPSGDLHFTTGTPINTTNSWWLDVTGFNLRKFNSSINEWETTPNNISIQPTAPGTPNNGDIWIRVIKGVFQLFEYNSSTGKFEKRKFSRFPVQDRTTNSVFVGETDENNFVIVCGEEALEGGPMFGGGGTGDLEIRKDGVTITTMASCINFNGPDFSVVDAGACVNVEHLPVTTLPEQSSTPVTVVDAGRIFTLEIGGRIELFYVDDVGNVTQLTTEGSTPQNIFLHVATTNAVAGQTIFSLPTTAKDILTVKINGVDTVAFTFTSPTLTYIPSASNYTIQTGDEVVILFYE